MESNLGARKEAGLGAGGARSPSPRLASRGRKRSLVAAAAVTERRAVAGAGGGKGGANSELRAGRSETWRREERARLSEANLIWGRSGGMRPKWSGAARTARTAQRAAGAAGAPAGAGLPSRGKG